MDPITGAALIGGGAQLLGGILGSSAASKAARAQSQAAADQLAFAREQFDYYRGQGEPMYQARDVAMSQLMSELGLPPIQAQMPGYQAPAQQPGEPVQQQPAPAMQQNGGWQQIASGLWRNPNTGEMKVGQAPPATPVQQPMATVAPTVTQPAPMEQAGQAGPQYFTPTPQNQLSDYDKFLLEEAQTAARMASGGQLDSRTLRDLQNQSAYIVQQSRENRLNRLASLAGLAQTSGGAASALAQGSAGQITGAMGNMGAARSSGYINRANQLTGTLQGLGQLAGFGAQQGWFGGGFTGTPSPGVAPGTMPIHLRGY